MKIRMKKLFALLVCAALVLAMGVCVFADEAAPTPDGAEVTAAAETTDAAASSTGSKAYAAAICVGVAAAAGAGAMGIAISKSAEGISRQPEAADKIRAGMMLGLVFIETAIIYALIVAILIIFVL